MVVFFGPTQWETERVVLEDSTKSPGDKADLAAGLLGKSLCLLKICIFEVFCF